MEAKAHIILASWDAEEYGLVGSTEWAEDHAADLQKNAVAYLNGDAVVTGPDLSMSGSPSLLALAMQAARDVPDPKAGGSVGSGWESRQRTAWAQQTPVDLGAKEDAKFFARLSPLGSGSDYTVFLDHLGVPSWDFGFNGSYGVYHSVYDNFRWMERYGDPEFLYHAAAARLWGLMAMRLASADGLPLRYSTYARDLQVDLDNMRETRSAGRARSRSPGPMRSRRSHPTSRRSSPRSRSCAPPAKPPTALPMRRSTAATLPLRRINEGLTSVESAFLDEKGLPSRPWFRHMLIGPGLTTGYAPWPFPALQQAIEQKDAAMFAAESKRVVAAIKAGAARLPK